MNLDKPLCLCFMPIKSKSAFFIGKWLKTGKHLLHSFPKFAFCPPWYPTVLICSVACLVLCNSSCVLLEYGFSSCFLLGYRADLVSFCWCASLYLWCIIVITLLIVSVPLEYWSGDGCTPADSGPFHQRIKIRSH